jgi:ribosome modulation factor
MSGNTLLDQQLAPTALTLRRARAFGRGCDARLAGLALAACPYPEQDYLATAWRGGWLDVDAHWAQDALWPHLDLPRVRAAP